jgi:TIR domain
MPDIFISYATPDRSKIEKLSAFLQQRGFDTWYDIELQSAERYRDTIGTKIDEARAVICVWTPNSVESEWCRAEAARAHRQKKLIPVRSSDLPYDQIPLPFGELQTISIIDEDAIARAVLKQLTAPRIMLPWYWRLWGGTKHEVLTWISIVGAVLTLATGLKNLFNLAGLVNLLIDHFLDLTNRFWSDALFFVPSITRYDSVILDLWLFFLVLFVTSCSREYVTPPLLSEKYLRDHLFGGTAAFIIIYIFLQVAQQLAHQGQSDSFIFGTLVTFTATHIFGWMTTGALIAARIAILLVFIAVPVGITLALGYSFDPAKYAVSMWRVIAGIAFLGFLSLAYQVLGPLIKGILS